MNIKKYYEKIKDKQFGPVENKILRYLRGQNVDAPGEFTEDKQQHSYGITPDPESISKENKSSFDKNQSKRSWSSLWIIRDSVIAKEEHDEINVGLKLNELSSYNLVERAEEKELDKDSEEWILTDFGVLVVNAYYDEIRADNRIDWDKSSLEEELSVIE